MRATVSEGDALVGVVKPGPLPGGGHAYPEPGVGWSTVLDPPGVGSLNFVPEPPGTVLADGMGRAPTAHLNRGPRSRNGVMDSNGMVVGVAGIILHDLVAMRDQQTDHQRPGEVADHLI